MHTDKPYYMAGDTIWLRAHVADASTLSPTALSKYVYVELRSAVKPASGEQPPAQQRIRLREREGVYAGYLPQLMTAESGDTNRRTVFRYVVLSRRRLSPDGRAVLEFYTGDNGADYSVLIEGIGTGDDNPILHINLQQ